MKLILHLGTGKTGSSAIQQALRKSARELEDVGVYFDPNNAGQNILQALIRDQSQWSRYFRTRPDPEKIVQKAREVLQRILRAIDSNKYRRIIISGENLFQFDAEEIDRFTSIFARKGLEIVTVCYVRRPSMHWASLSQQILKASTRFPHPSRYRYRVRSKLELWADAPGVSQQIVRSFERSSLIGGNVVSDFVETVLPEARGIIDERMVSNASLSAEAIIMMQRYRAITHKGRNDVFTEQGTKVVQALRALMTDEPGTPFKAKPYLLDYVDRVHLEQTRWLQQKYGISLLSPQELQRIESVTLEKVPEHIPGIEEVCESYDAAALERLQYKVIHKLATSTEQAQDEPVRLKRSWGRGWKRGWKLVTPRAPPS